MVLLCCPCSCSVQPLGGDHGGCEAETLSDLHTLFCWLQFEVLAQKCVTYKKRPLRTFEANDPLVLLRPVGEICNCCQDQDPPAPYVYATQICRDNSDVVEFNYSYFLLSSVVCRTTSLQSLWLCPVLFVGRRPSCRRKELVLFRTTSSSPTWWRSDSHSVPSA